MSWIATANIPLNLSKAASPHSAKARTTTSVSQTVRKLNEYSDLQVEDPQTATPIVYPAADRAALAVGRLAEKDVVPAVRVEDVGHQRRAEDEAHLLRHRCHRGGQREGTGADHCRRDVDHEPVALQRGHKSFDFHVEKLGGNVPVLRSKLNVLENEAWARSFDVKHIMNMKGWKEEEEYTEEEIKKIRGKHWVQ